MTSKPSPSRANLRKPHVVPTRARPSSPPYTFSSSAAHTPFHTSSRPPREIARLAHMASRRRRRLICPSPPSPRPSLEQRCIHLLLNLRDDPVRVLRRLHLPRDPRRLARVELLTRRDLKRLDDLEQPHSVARRAKEDQRARRASLPYTVRHAPISARPSVHPDGELQVRDLCLPHHSRHHRRELELDGLHHDSVRRVSNRDRPVIRRLRRIPTLPFVEHAQSRSAHTPRHPSILAHPLVQHPQVILEPLPHARDRVEPRVEAVVPAHGAFFFSGWQPCILSIS